MSCCPGNIFTPHIFFFQCPKIMYVPQTDIYPETLYRCPNIYVAVPDILVAPPRVLRKRKAGPGVGLLVRHAAGNFFSLYDIKLQLSFKPRYMCRRRNHRSITELWHPGMPKMVTHKKSGHDDI